MNGRSVIWVWEVALWSWKTNCIIFLISGLRRDVDEICGPLGNYTVSCGNYLPMFRDNVSVPSSRVKIPRGKKACNKETGQHSGVGKCATWRQANRMREGKGGYKVTICSAAGWEEKCLECGSNLEGSETNWTEMNKRVTVQKPRGEKNI
jgi:hypothetical protein